MRSPHPFAPAFAAAILIGTLGCHAQSVPNRFLYVVDCDAIVEKLDTVTQRRIANYDLASRTGNIALIPKVKEGLDGCLANQTTYLASTSTLYTVVPEEADPSPSGTHNYRVLGFSVPGLELVKQFPAGKNLSGPPALSVSSGATMPVVDTAEASPVISLDLAEFSPSKTATPNQILESSSTRVLLRLFTANPAQLVIAVADRHLKRVVRLSDLPATTALNVHLAPGGAYVMVEVVAGTGPPATKTGQLALYSSATGELLKEVSAPQMKPLYFLAISPSGRAVYRKGASVSFIDLGQQFSNEAVVQPVTKSLPYVFFSDR